MSWLQIKSMDGGILSMNEMVSCTFKNERFNCMLFCEGGMVGNTFNHQNCNFHPAISQQH